MLLLLLALSLQEEPPDALLEALEKKSRSLQTCQAEFDLTFSPAVSRFTIVFDRPGRRMHITLFKGTVATEHYLMEGWKFSQWKDESTCLFTDMTPYAASMERALSDVFSKLGVAKDESWDYALGIDLERKPAKDEYGKFQFYSCIGRAPYRWLGLLRDEKNLQLVRQEKSLVFKIAERRKTVTLDRENGFLRSIEAVNYDDTVASVVCRSAVFDAPLPAFPVPPKGRERPPTQGEIEEVLAGRRRVFKDLAAVIIRKWDDVVKSGRVPAVGEAFRREFETMSSIWYEGRLHQVAAWWVRQRLGSGIPWKTLHEGVDTEIEQFLKTMASVRETDRKFLAGQYQEFVGVLEGLFRDNAPKSADPSEYRKLFPATLDLDLKPIEKRPEDIFKAELENARAL